MANRALINIAGITQQIANGNSLYVGDAIERAPTTPGALGVGTTSSTTSLNLGTGSAVATVNIGTVMAAAGTIAIGTAMTGGTNVINIGTTMTIGDIVNIGAGSTGGLTNSKVIIRGDLDVQGVTTLMGTTEFQNPVTFDSDVTIGNGVGTDRLFFNTPTSATTTGGVVGSDMPFNNNADHMIFARGQIAGGDVQGTGMTYTSGDGSAADGVDVGGSGGTTTLLGAFGGAASTLQAGWGGSVNIKGGDAGAGAGVLGNLGGDVNVNGGAGTGTSVGGVVSIGAAANTSSVVVGHTGITTTVNGALVQQNGAVTLGGGTGVGSSSWTTTVGSSTITINSKGHTIFQANSIRLMEIANDSTSVTVYGNFAVNVADGAGNVGSVIMLGGTTATSSFKTAQAAVATGQITRGIDIIPGQGRTASGGGAGTAGGALTLTSGKGGNAAVGAGNVASAAGAFNITGGAGGDAATALVATAGAAVRVTGGAAGTESGFGTGADGGNVELTGGLAVSQKGGSILIKGGNTTDLSGGDIYVDAGDFTGTGNAGGIYIGSLVNTTIDIGFFGGSKTVSVWGGLTQSGAAFSLTGSITNSLLTTATGAVETASTGLDIGTGTAGASAGVAVGGDAGAITQQAGDGGAAWPVAATNFAGGKGGPVRIYGGVGGVASTSGIGAAGLGGLIKIQAGTGGASAASTAAAGGPLDMQSGIGGAGSATKTPAAGGSASLTSGDAGAVGGFGGGANSGNVTVTVGNKSGTGVTGNLLLGTGIVPTATTINGTTLNLQAASGNLMVGTASTMTIQTGVTLTTAGLGMINLPQLFQIDGVPTTYGVGALGTGVGALHLNQLTDGPMSNVDHLHTHATGTATSLSVTLDTTALVAGESAYVTTTTATAGKSKGVITGNQYVFVGITEATNKVTVAGIVAAAKFVGSLTPVVGDIAYVSNVTPGSLTNVTTTFTTVGTDVIQKVGIITDVSLYAGSGTCAVLLSPQMITQV